MSIVDNDLNALEDSAMTALRMLRPLETEPALVLGLIQRLRTLRTQIEDIESYAWDYIDDASMREVQRMAVAALDSDAGKNL